VVVAWLQARADGELARRNGEPRDAKPYMPRYEGARGARDPQQAWYEGWDHEDDRLAAELSRPRHGESDWSPVKRRGTAEDT
jgi:hypothetical protein